jgi:arylsulfatase A-like enzyme
MEMHPFDNGQLTIRDELLAAIPRKETEVRQHLAEYYAMISHVDNQIGKVIHALRESGKLDETIIVFAGDNGLSLGRHGLMGKQNLYEHSIHIPLVMVGPGVPRGQVNKANVYTLDIYPTLCALTGTTPPKGLMGESLVPVLSGEAETPRAYFYYAYKELMRAVNVNGEKLIEYNIRGQRHTQLFNLNFDQMETNDISDDPMHLPDVHRLRLKMLEAREEYGDYLPPFDSFWEGF